MNYSLVLLRQTSLAEEKFSKNGIQKNVFVVVKNSSFAVQLGFSHHLTELDFNRLSIESTLIYDCEEGKQVDFVKLKPMEYKSHANENGDQCTVELRIKVLTSQLEDMFFRIKFRAIDAMTKIPFPNLETLSEPIKVISKPDQLKKKSTKSKKRTVTDLLVETLSRIEERQNEQQKLLATLYTKADKPEQPSTCESNVPRGFTKLNTSSEDFETFFTIFLNSFNSLSSEEKPAKIRKLIRTIPSRDLDQLTELLDIFWAEGLQKQMRREIQPNEVQGLNNCDVIECPHKKELERIDEFYKEFLSTSYLSGNLP